MSEDAHGGVPWSTCDGKRTECQTRLHTKLDAVVTDVSAIKVDVATIKSAVEHQAQVAGWWKDMLKSVVAPIILIVIVGIVALLVTHGLWK